MLDTELKGLHAGAPHALSFAPSLHVRSFALERPGGNLLIYGAPHVPDLGGITAHYLNHWHEAGFVGDGAGAPVVIHEADAPQANADRTFARREVLGGDFELIPTPGHTPGATAFLWDSGQHRFLFTGDTVYLRGGEWVAAVLDSSDREAYVESLELLRTLDFDVLVPWAASAGEPYYARTDAGDSRARFDALIKKVRARPTARAASRAGAGGR